MPSVIQGLPESKAMGYFIAMVLNLFQRIKTLWIALGFLAFAVIAIVGSYTWSLSKGFVQPRLQLAFANAAGLELTGFRDATFTALPWPSVHITNLSLKKTDAASPDVPVERLTIPLLKARVSLASWLTGHPQIVTLALFDPTVNLAATANITEPDQFIKAITGIFNDTTRQPPRSIRVQRGLVTRDGAELIKNIQLSLSSVASADVRVRASGNYQDTPFQISADLARHMERQERAVRWSITTSSMNAQFRGSLLSPHTLDAEGELNVSIINGSKLATRLKLNKEQSALLDGLQLSGQTRIALPTLQIRNAVIERSSEKLNGTVEMNLDPRKLQFSATLDSKNLDLTPLIAPFMNALVQDKGEWSRQKFNTEWFKAATADIRLSATRLSLGIHTVEHAALSGRMNAGRMEFILSDGRLNAGNIKARSVISLLNDTVDIRAQGSFDKLDVGAFFETMKVNRLRGQATGQFSFEAIGSSAAELVEAAEGRSSLAIKDGELTGIDFERVLSRLERPLTRTLVPPSLLEGRTRFQTATAQLRLSGGKITLNNSWLAMQNFRVPLDGTVSVNNRTIDVTARLLPGGEIPKAGDILIRIEGPWANPIIYPDLTGRIKRS
jgi:AsmA protein